MRVTMTVTKPGAVNGIKVREFAEGKTYEVPKDLDRELAEVFLKEKWAVDADARPAAAPVKPAPQK